MTCRDCVGYSFCSIEKTGNTRFYGTESSCDDVENRCGNFKNKADVVEVKRGHWIDKLTGRYGHVGSWCSVCQQKSGIGGRTSNRHKPFCPNCGAKMNEGETV